MLENKLKGKKIAIVAMGRSQLDYHLSISHSQEYDEVWAIGSMCAVVNPDRAFIMDPATRFFDTFDAFFGTFLMRFFIPFFIHCSYIFYTTGTHVIKKQTMTLT